MVELTMTAADIEDTNTSLGLSDNFERAASVPGINTIHCTSQGNEQVQRKMKGSSICH